MITKVKGYGAWERHDFADTIPAEPAEFTRLVRHLEQRESPIPLPTRCTGGGGCRQGREVCRTPHACQVSEAGDGLDAARGVLNGLAMSAAIFCLVALIVYLI
jgi:hypothetical protein